jgi:hypothetical protein
MYYILQMKSKIKQGVFMQAEKLDPDKCATLIRAGMAIQRVKQTKLAEQTGIPRVLLNMYLNRKLNLLPEQIEKLLTELNPQEEVGRLSASMQICPKS